MEEFWGWQDYLNSHKKSLQSGAWNGKGLIMSMDEWREKTKGYECTNRYLPKTLVFDPPYTIVHWNDGTKTIVKCKEDEQFVEEVGFASALMKKIFGERNKYLKIVENAHRVKKNKKVRKQKED